MISLGEFILPSLIVLSAVLATVYLNRKLKEKGYRVNNLLNVLVVLTVSTALCLVGTSVAWILNEPSNKSKQVHLYINCQMELMKKAAPKNG